MRILLAASEAVPFCKTGGLADVVGALGPALAKAGNQVCLFLPKYREIRSPNPVQKLPGSFSVPMGGHPEKVELLSTQWKGVTVYFVECPKYFDRDGLYLDEKGKDFQDNDERFILYSRAVLEGAKFVDFKPDILHCHDWQAALVCTYLKTHYDLDAFYSSSRSLLTVHNIAYQGQFPKEALFLAGFGWAHFTPEKLEFYGGVNFLKAGLVYGDSITTVSPTYAKQIQQSEEFGRGMEGVLRFRAGKLVGVINGIDWEVWNPESDCALPVRYGAAHALSGKKACKEALLKSCSMKTDVKAPLAAIVSRLDPQKGLDWILELLPILLSRSQLQLVVLGSGDKKMEKGFSELAGKFPGLVAYHGGFNEPLAHQIYAAGDLFLMPSRFEPCGLGQMIAMRYGSVPVVTQTGGLADTVQDGHNGFAAEQASPEAFRQALSRALDSWKSPKDWKRLVQNAMKTDSSWDSSIKIYLDLYRRLLPPYV